MYPFYIEPVSCRIQHEPAAVIVVLRCIKRSSTIRRLLPPQLPHAAAATWQHSARHPRVGCWLQVPPRPTPTAPSAHAHSSASSQARPRACPGPTSYAARRAEATCTACNRRTIVTIIHFPNTRSCWRGSWRQICRMPVRAPLAAANLLR
jgi:hypothetical protein